MPCTFVRCFVGTDGIVRRWRFRASTWTTRAVKRIQSATHNSNECGRTDGRAGVRLLSMPSPVCRCRPKTNSPLDGNSILMFDGVSTTASLPVYFCHFVSVGTFPFHNSSCSAHFTHSIISTTQMEWTTHLCVACKLISSFVAFRWRENPLDRYQCAGWIARTNIRSRAHGTIEPHSLWLTHISILVRYHQFGIINGAPNCSRTFNDEQRRRAIERRLNCWRYMPSSGVCSCAVQQKSQSPTQANHTLPYIISSYTILLIILRWILFNCNRFIDIEPWLCCHCVEYRGRPRLSSSSTSHSFGFYLFRRTCWFVCERDGGIGVNVNRFNCWLIRFVRITGFPYIYVYWCLVPCA